MPRGHDNPKSGSESESIFPNLEQKKPNIISNRE